MSHKIPCPHCQHVLSVKDPKPGKYKPKCSSCGEPFALVVDDSSPPKIKVGKLASAQHAKEPADAVAPKPPERSTISRPAISGLDETMPPDAHIPPRPSSLDATIDQTLESAPSVDRNGTNRPLQEVAPKQTASQGKTERPDQTQAFDRPAESLDTNGNQSSNESRSPRSESPSTAMPAFNRLGGYRIVKEIGAGGMGSVYLARQLSLDRPCALKTIQAHWAKNPRVIARFIREAYAAAQLTHHNVVQIYDLGQEAGTNFFSMELVGGGSLDDQLKSKGKLPPKLAATLILQAARGLKFAHDHGMVHRDVKPANLMMTSDGLVKVADMGLIKTPTYDEGGAANSNESDVQSLMLASARSQVTMQGASMGTPAYMSPEQSSDAASVDKRADIYSLGCTFYALLTGKPPFEGDTLMEVITKHRTEKLVRPERVISGLPTVLGDIIEKMTEKAPADRYQDLDEVICDIEVYLELREDMSHAKVIHNQADRKPDSDSSSKGTEPNGGTKPAPAPVDVSPEIAGQIQSSAKAFSSSPLLMVRSFAPMAWVGLCSFLAITSLLFALWSGLQLSYVSATNVLSQVTGTPKNDTAPEGDAAGTAAGTPVSGTSSRIGELMGITKFRLHAFLGYLVAMLIGPIAAIALAGRDGQSPLALRWRESLIAGGWLEWVFWGFGILVALLILYFLGLWLTVLVGLIAGVAAGAGYYFGIEKPIAASRAAPLEQSHALLKQLRLKGTDEQRVRQAIANHAGKRWEEYFEQLFGYDSMRSMRAQVQSSKPVGAKPFLPLRDRLIDRWNLRIDEMRRDKDERTLEKAEQADLKAAGVSAAEAKKQAAEMAATLVEAAGETRQSMREIAAGQLTAQGAEDKRQRIKQMLAEARSGKFTQPNRSNRSLNRMLGQLLGSKFRFVCAGVLLLGVGLWVHSNSQALEVYWQKAKATASSTMDSIKNTKLDANSLAGASQAALNNAKEQVQSTIAQSQSVPWTSVGAGMVHERNVVFIALAGLLMLWGTFLSGWRISLLLVPIAILLCALPRFLF